mmetsp:Transcript_18363/g.24578  ORF Transcript_18363/g.24578 Transcript_18363/m.24578 type:complete len:307 (-) Transcript_18363:564-1484(-)
MMGNDAKHLIVVIRGCAHMRGWHHMRLFDNSAAVGSGDVVVTLDRSLKGGSVVDGKRDHGMVGQGNGYHRVVGQRGHAVVGQRLHAAVGQRLRAAVGQRLHAVMEERLVVRQLGVSNLTVGLAQAKMRLVPDGEVKMGTVSLSAADTVVGVGIATLVMTAATKTIIFETLGAGKAAPMVELAVLLAVGLLHASELMLLMLVVEMAAVLLLENVVMLVTLLRFLRLGHMLVGGLSLNGHHSCGHVVLAVVQLLSDVRLHLQNEVTAINVRLRGAEGGRVGVEGGVVGFVPSLRVEIGEVVAPVEIKA